MKIQKDCVLLRRHNNTGEFYCSGLKHLYCTKEKCKFYKSNKYYRASDEGYCKR